MTNLAKEAIIDAMRAFLEEGNSQNNIANASGVNSAYVSHILTGKHWEEPSLVPERAWRQLETFLKVRDVPLESENFKKVVGMLHVAKTQRTAAIIDAPTGSGKSYAAEYFRMKHPKATYLIRCAQDMTTRELLRQVHEAVIDKRHSGKTLAEMRSDCQLILGQRYADSPLLIIDEAENLRDSAYGIIKALYDSLEGKIGIVLIGANDYCQYLNRKALAVRKNRTRVDCFPQIWRRFKTNAIVLNGMTDQDAVNIMKLAGIQDREIVMQVVSTATYHSDVYAAINQMRNQD